MVVQQVEVDTVRATHTQSLTKLEAIQPVANHIEHHRPRVRCLQIASRHLQNERHGTGHSCHNTTTPLNTAAQLRDLRRGCEACERHKHGLVRVRRPNQQMVRACERGGIFRQHTMGCEEATIRCEADRLPRSLMFCGEYVQRGAEGQQWIKWRRLERR